HMLSSMIFIPHGYEVAYLPEPVSIDNELFSLTFLTEGTGDMLTVQLEYATKRALYPAEDYTRIRNFFEQLVSLFNEKIVLTKSTE
ncbi:MAG: hypothetical protein AAFV07_17840, partial [Bacteroidota bacterium]